MNERIVRPPVAQEVDEEVRFHVEMRVRELVAAGMTEETARAEALRRLGDIDRLKADMRELGEGRDAVMRRREWWDEVAQNVTFAVRQLRHAPSFTAVAVLTLALAIAANTAVFAVADGVLLKPLPYAQPDRLVNLWAKYLPPSGFDIPKFSMSGPEFLDFQEETKTLASLGAYRAYGSVTLTGDDRDVERVRVAWVSASLLPTLGVKPALGRWFTEAEDVPDGPAVTILGHDLWVSRYGSDPGVVGRSILLNDLPTQVVGVMPEGFVFPGRAGAYLPLRITRAYEGGRASHSLVGVGRLTPGTTLEDLNGELAVVRERWATEYEHNVGHFLWAIPLKADLLGDAPQVLHLLLAAVGLVLLVACANMANLLLARGERRLEELAVRRVLGAGRGRITRQLVTESVVLSAVAALVAVPLAVVGTRLLIALDPAALPRLAEVRVHPLALAFTLAVALAAALVFGVAPAWAMGSREASSVAGSAARSAGGRRRTALQRVLVAGEVGVSLVVMVLAGLLVRSFREMASTDPGFRDHDVMAFGVSLPPASYPDAALICDTYVRLLDRMRAVPGVQAATAGTFFPFSGDISRYDFQLDDRPPRQAGDGAWNAGLAVVMPDYFETLGIPLVEGRGLALDDDADAPLVGVVSETMARTYWPGQSALGKRWGYGRDDGSIAWIRVVGVVADQFRSRVDEEDLPVAYVPELQASRIGGSVPSGLGIALRTSVDPLSVTTAVRAAIKELDPGLPITNVRAMSDVVSTSMARPRLTTSLLGTFALLAVVLALVGVYGVVAYSVAGRTREIGVRVALGAGRDDILRMVTGQGAIPVAAGVVLGLGGAWLATRLVAAMLYGVVSTDPVTFVTLPLLLLVVGVVASFFPALRATRIAPTEALRGD